MTGAPFDRLRLAALRYAVNDEAEQYVAVMRVFTEGTAGLLSDLSTREVAERLIAYLGIELDVDLAWPAARARPRRAASANTSRLERVTS